MLISSTVLAWVVSSVEEILAKAICSVEVVKKRFSITNKMDSTAVSPNTSINPEIKSRHEFLIFLTLYISSSFS